MAAGASPVLIVKDSFSIVASVTGVIATVAPEVAAFGQVLSTITNILGLIHDLKKTTPIADPYVTQLSNLTAADATTTQGQIGKYIIDTETAAGNFYNSIFSDWFRLQTVALLTINRNYGGWYINDANAARTGYITALTTTQRGDLYEQILPTYFSKVAYNGVNTLHHFATDKTDEYGTFKNFFSKYNGPQLYGFDAQTVTDYSWDSRTSSGTRSCEDYTLIFLTNQWGKTWSSTFGDILFGNGTGQLSMDRNFIYDLIKIPWWSGYPYTVVDQTGGGDTWKCAESYPPVAPDKSQIPVFSGLQSTVITQGVTAINLTGRLTASLYNSPGTAYPPGFVSITIGTMTFKAGLDPLNYGTFTYNVPVASLKSSPFPYTVTYQYSGYYGNVYYVPVSDSSTTLTINSTDSEVLLSANIGSSTYPGAVSLTAVVKSPAALPTGTVNFYDGSTQIGSSDLVKGQASVSANGLSGGVHTYSAQYLGQSPIQSGLSDSIAVTIERLPLILAGYLQPWQVQYGAKQVSIIGSILNPNTLAPPAGDPITLALAGVQQPATLTGPGGLFSFVWNLPTPLPVGAYPVSISYAGNTNFLPFSSSKMLLQIVQTAPTFNSLSASQSITAGTNSIILSGAVGTTGGSVPTGFVTATINGVQSNPVNVINGAFLLNFTASSIPASATAYPITYTYSGDNNYSAVTDNSTTLTVQVLSTTTTVTSSASVANYGTPITITAAVTSVKGMPTGSVLFYDGGTALGAAVPLSGGLATFTTSSLLVGAHTITAAYDGGNTSYAPSKSAVLSQTINKATPVFSNLTPPQSISAGTASITLGGKLAAGSVFPVGSVSVSVNGVSTPATVGSDGSFSATVDTHALIAKPYIVTYSYAGGGNFNAASDASTTITVQSTSTTTTLVSSAPVADYGTSVIFTAGVTSQGGTPTGTVMFYDSGAALGSPVTLTAGKAMLSTNTLAVGTHTITATYTSDVSGYGGSTSATLQQTINKLNPVFSNLTPSQSISAGTASVKLSGKLAAGSVIPVGSVSISVNGVSTPATVGSDGSFSATVDTHALIAKAYSVNYAYAGGGNFSAVSDASTTITVQSTSTTTTLMSSAATADYGTSVTFTVGVTSQGGTPTGSVTFNDGGAALGSPVTLTAGKATFSTSTLAVGTHTITATYISDGPGYGGSISTTIQQVINKLTAVFRNLTPSHLISAGTASITLGGKLTAGSLIPVGTVSVTVNGTSTPATLGSDGSFSATVDTHALIAKAYTVTYSYAGGDNFNAAADSTTAIVIQSTPTTTTLTSSAAVANYGASVTFTAAVASQGGTPSGTVTFSDSGAVLGSPVTLTAGKAMLSTSTLAVGTHTITASYLSDVSGYEGSTSATLQQAINKLAPVFSNLTPSQTISAGTASVRLSGKLAAGSFIPGGNVTVSISGASTPATLGSDGSFSATVDTHALIAKPYIVTYSYAGGGNFNAANDASTTITVQSTSTTTALTSSAAAADYGTSVTFTAAVVGQGGTPTGTVMFYDSGAALGSPVTLTAGKAMLSTNTLAVGTHTITAMYTSDVSGYGGSTSATLQQTINKLNPVFSNLTPSQSISAGAASVKLSGRLAGGSFIPLGSVTVSINGASTPATLGSDGSFSATVDTHALIANTYSVSYAYAGGGNFNTAVDSSTTITVQSPGPVQSQVFLTATPNPATQGQTVVFKASVPQIGSITPRGNVTISETAAPDGTPLPTPLIYGNADLADGVATIVVDSTSRQQLSPGLHKYLFATYGGNPSTYTGATSPAYTLTVQPTIGVTVEKASLKFDVSGVQKSGNTVTLKLNITNTGTGNALDVAINQLTLKTLNGTGDAALVTSLPISVGQIAPLDTITKTVNLTLTVPASVQRLSITETGTLRDITTPSAAFSASQAVIIPN